jgi:hypothetical protein
VIEALGSCAATPLMNAVRAWRRVSCWKKFKWRQVSSSVSYALEAIGRYIRN